MLRSKIYLGYVECKVTGTTARSEHAPIITQELFDAVQLELENNSNHKSGRTSGSLSESSLYAPRKSEQYSIRQRGVQRGGNLCHRAKISNLICFIY